MDAKEYLRLAMGTEDEQQALSDKIDTLSHAERIELRTKLEASGCRMLARNLYFDYELQMWILEAK